MVIITKKRNGYKTKSSKKSRSKTKKKSINKKKMRGGSNSMYVVPPEMRWVNYDFVNLENSGYADLGPFGSTLSRTPSTLSSTLSRTPSGYEQFYPLNPNYVPTKTYTTLSRNPNMNKSGEYISVNSNPDPDTGYISIKPKLFHGKTSPNIQYRAQQLYGNVKPKPYNTSSSIKPLKLQSM